MIPATKFACPRHWFSLTKDARARIWAAYKAYCADKLPLEELRKIQSDVIAEATGA
jgi:hypothetical protein